MSERGAAGPVGVSMWSAGRFALLLGVPIGAGLAVLAGVAPGRGDLLAAAATGAAFGGGTSLAGHALVARVAARSVEKGVQLFLAVMTVKVILFAAFLLTIALVTSLDPVALAAGLAGATLLGEGLVVTSLKRLERRKNPNGR